jgi:phosphoglycerol transferase MdoB-like AlkP superfamily enzyme
MSLITFSVILFIFTILILIYSFSKKSYAVGGWITIILLMVIVLSLMNQGNPNHSERIHPSYLIAKYNSPE